MSTSIKIWIDDVRPAPSGYVWCKSVFAAKNEMDKYYTPSGTLMVDEINLDHDAGAYAKVGGGDYIKLLKWMEQAQYTFGFKFHKTIFKFHSMNPVGVENMKRICRANGWRHE